MDTPVTPESPPAGAPPSPGAPPPAAAQRLPFGGLLLILLGVLFLAGNLGAIEVHHAIERWWPLVLILLGLTKLVNAGARGLASGILLVTLGSLLLAFSLGYLPWRMVDQLWPLALVAVGISMLFRGRRR
ncbi:MAG: hypothetical protein A2W00_10030 [Candidatus Eisenbacteria bacterium RBG_16_71_46]|nr:MAG: hypothetical protein A2W00_10030 [Candidatus Eisenbacteria bacterium RBG_16_71_46]